MRCTPRKVTPARPESWPSALSRCASTSASTASGEGDDAAGGRGSVTPQLCQAVTPTAPVTVDGMADVPRSGAAWTRRTQLAFAGLCIAWGIPYLLIKVAVDELSPVALVVGRTGIAALLLLPVAVARGALRPVLPAWRWLLAFTLTEVAVPWLLLSDAERKLPSSLTGLLIAAVPLGGAAVARLTGSTDRTSPLQLVGLFIGLLGVAALLGLDVGGAQVEAVLECGAVVLCYSIGPAILARKLGHLPAMGVITTSLGLTALGYLPFAAGRLPAHVPSGSVIAAVVVLAVVCTAGAFLLLFHLVAVVGPVRATVVTYVNPAVALAAGVVLLGEPLTLGAVLGFALVLVGSALAARGRRPKPGQVDEPGATARGTRAAARG